MILSHALSLYPPPSPLTSPDYRYPIDIITCSLSSPHPHLHHLSPHQTIGILLILSHALSLYPPPSPLTSPDYRYPVDIITCSPSNPHPHLSPHQTIGILLILSHALSLYPPPTPLTSPDYRYPVDIITCSLSNPHPHLSPHQTIGILLILSHALCLTPTLTSITSHLTRL